MCRLVTRVSDCAVGGGVGQALGAPSWGSLAAGVWEDADRLPDLDREAGSARGGAGKVRVP